MFNQRSTTSKTRQIVRKDIAGERCVEVAAFREKA
jgi:hypothetical protein